MFGDVGPVRPRPSTSPTKSRLPKTPRAQPSQSPLIAKRFEFIRRLGEGSFGKVDLVRDRTDGQERVCKVIDTLGMKRAVLDQMKREIQILSELDSPHVVKIFHYVEDKDAFQLVLVLEYIAGGGCDRLLKSEGGHLTEMVTARLVRQLCTAVNYCHSKGIVHRDIKPEHMMLVRPDIGGSHSLKVIDFGLAAHAEAMSVRRLDRTGTPAYMAPEVVCQEAQPAFKADVWSIGVCTLEMLTGESVFKRDGSQDSYEKIRHYKGFDEVDRNLRRSPEWRRLSNRGKDFVRCLLTLDPGERPTASDALNHPWLVKVKAICAGETGQAIQGLAEYARASPVIRCCLLMIARHSTASCFDGCLGEALAEKFSSNNGRISREDLFAVIGRSVGFGSDGISTAALLAAAGFEDGSDIDLVELGAACSLTKYSSTLDIAVASFQAADSNHDGVADLVDVCALLGNRRFSWLDSLPQGKGFSRDRWCESVRLACGGCPSKVSKLRLSVSGSRSLARGGA